MAHSGPPNDIATSAAVNAAAVTNGYLNDLSALLISKSGTAFNYKVARNAAEELRYTWVLSTRNKINKDIQAMIDRLKAQNEAGLQPIIDQLEKQHSLLPGTITLAALFNTNWDDDIWKAIEASRAQWHSLSESLWRIADEAQRQALSLIETASRQGIPFNKVKSDLAALLTEKGSANMDYNVRRLWATELRRNRIVAQQSIWDKVGVVKQVRLARSATADITCPICGQAIGPNPLDERIVPIDWPDMPPYHPWCQCTTRPVEPTQKEMKDYLDKKYGESPLGKPQRIGFVPPIPTPKPAPEPQVTQAQIDQAFQDAHIEDNLRTWDKQIDDMMDSLVQARTAGPNKVQAIRAGLHQNLDSMVGKFGTPHFQIDNPLVQGPSRAWYVPRGDIVLNASEAGSPAHFVESVTHEYGHYLAQVLDDMSGLQPTWLNTRDLEKAVEAIQNAMGALNQYAFRTVVRGARGRLDSVLQYTKTAVPARVRALKDAQTQMRHALDNYEFGRSFNAGFSDLTGNWIKSDTRHDVDYFKRTDFKYWPKVGSIGMVDEEVLNEFTSAYLEAWPSERITIDNAMYTYAPDLWTAMHGWIDLFIGH